MKRTIQSILPMAGTILLSLVLCSGVMADTFRVKVKRVTAEAGNGDIIIQVKPGSGETDFTEKSRVMLVGTDPGTDRAMAVLLTAVSLNTEVLIEVANPPSFNDVQIVTSLSLVPP